MNGCKDIFERVQDDHSAWSLGFLADYHRNG